jgi:PAS domain S-box-containing protein
MDELDRQSPKSNRNINLFIPGQINFDYLKAAHDHSPMGVLAVNIDGSINYANEAALVRYNIKAGDGVTNRTVLALLEDMSPSKSNEAKLLALEEFTDQEFKIKGDKGDQWFLISSKVHRDDQGNVRTFLFIRDTSKLKKKEKLFSYLNQAATALAQTRDTQTALQQIADFIVPTFANWFTIDQINNGKLDLLILKHEDASKIAWAHEYRKKYPADMNGNTGPALVIKSGKSGFVPVITDQMIDVIVTDPIQREEVRKIGLHSVMIIPIYNRHEITGLANFISSVPEKYFDETDLEFAEHFANLIGLALENTRLNEAAEKEIILKQQSEQRFRFLTDAIPHKMWTSGPDGRATYYNKQWHDYTGIEGFDALREKIWDFIHPDDRAIAAVEWPRAIKSGENMEMEHRLMRHDGTYRWHLSRFTAFKNDSGQSVLWVGTSTDIHDQKAASLDLATVNEELTAANEEFVAMNEELASVNEELSSTNEELAATNEELTETQGNLQRSEKLFRSIALNIPGSLIIVIDKDHRYLTIEGDIMEKMGYDRGNYEGKHPAEISPERYEASRNLYERVISGEKFSVERRAETGENYIVHFVPLKNDHGIIDSGLIIALDISEIKKAEEKGAKLAAIVESSDDAIISKTFESVITSWNRSAERMFGYSEEEMLGQTIYKIIPENRHHEEPEILSLVRNGMRVEHFETKRLTKDGRELDVSLTISPVRDVQGNIIGLSKIARDITEKKLEEQRKNDFIGMVSHELKTPLTSLNAIVQLAATKIKTVDNPFLVNAMERASVQLKKMTAMINGFLNVSRLEAGKMHLEKEYFDIDELLREIVDETSLIVVTNEVKITGCESIQVFADREKISSVVSNLISNAVKYSPNGKPIEVNCISSNDEVVVGIKDGGMGINPANLEHIFDRYFRVETNYTRNISGFGIGLYLSAEIIKLHGGKIWAESLAGMGSTFYFSLPIKGGEANSG